MPDAETLERQNGRASTLVGTTGHQKAAAIARHRCKCGARRIDSQLGLEPTPEQYVENMVAVFREVRRVLRSDGTVWLNLGDSYASTGGERTYGSSDGGTGRGPGTRRYRNVQGTSDTEVGLHGVGASAGEAAEGAGAHLLDEGGTYRAANGTPRLKPKDLVGIPWRVAFALQADGWYLRSDIIWSKPNPMPESVTDRPTKSHEYLFLLAKGQWKAAVVELTDPNRKRRHLGDDGWFEGPHMWANEVAVGLASVILDSPQLQQEVGLPSLHPQVGPEPDHGFYRDLVGRLPVEHRAAIGAARLLATDSSPEQFLRELHSLGVTLADRDHLLIGGVASVLPLPPGIHGYGQASITVDYPGEIREFEFVHGRIITSTPTTCTYYYDADAVREPHTESTLNRIEYGLKHRHPGDVGVGIPPVDTERMGERFANPSGRNMRSVWSIATAPYPGAHFATFPPKLVEPCIKAGTSERGVCPECGAPWVREVERERGGPTGRHARRPTPTGVRGNHNSMGKVAGSDTRGLPSVTTTTSGWGPSCRHFDHWYPCDCGKCPPYVEQPVPATVLDPFAGSGTTGMVAQSLSRRAVLIDLSMDYLGQLMKRNRDIPLGLQESA